MSVITSDTIVDISNVIDRNFLIDSHKNFQTCQGKLKFISDFKNLKDCL